MPGTEQSNHLLFLSGLLAGKAWLGWGHLYVHSMSPFLGIPPAGEPDIVCGPGGQGSRVTEQGLQGLLTQGSGAGRVPDPPLLLVKPHAMQLRYKEAGREV